MLACCSDCVSVSVLNRDRLGSQGCACMLRVQARASPLGRSRCALWSSTSLYNDCPYHYNVHTQQLTSAYNFSLFNAYFCTPNMQSFVCSRVITINVCQCISLATHSTCMIVFLCSNVLSSALWEAVGH